MLQVIKSVLAAFLGVQSEKNRQQDFQSRSPWPFIVTGVVMTLVFVLVVASVARWAAS
ncbi:Protein of unknown function [Marinospirillum celere]|uniref:DUF2970 domain-containing protein n=1 Tax=Marinospirillum celere TaxID=1122252 RepID=A0A1I1J4D7_9GAMM|nr:DUF2970 domain-containing protein [Marinospirillum celere]SFC40320.1 Protein of unknown function [Marinospirillum celere]